MSLRKTIPLLLIFLNLHAQEKDTIGNRFSIHVQATVINQIKPRFYAPYTGTNSLHPDYENQTSITSTLFLGARLWKGAAVFFNEEIAGGSGLSQVLGLGDAINGETFRIGSSSPKLYVARAYFQQRFNLSHPTEFQADDENTIQEYIPTNYINLTAGKICITDFFDKNSYSHDPRSQFMNWGLMANGAWDYAANTRGYTSGIVLEYINPKNEWRYSFALLPKVANGSDMNWNVSKQNSQNLEYTHHYKLFKNPGTFRILTYLNLASMGNYN